MDVALSPLASNNSGMMTRPVLMSGEYLASSGSPLNSVRTIFDERISICVEETDGDHGLDINHMDSNTMVQSVEKAAETFGYDASAWRPFCQWLCNNVPVLHVCILLY